MPKHSLFDDVAPVEAGLRNINDELEQHVNEVDQSGSDKHEKKHAPSPSHEAQVEYGPRNDHEQVLFKDEPESDQNGSISDKDNDENEDMDENEDEDKKEEENGNEIEDGSITINLSDVQKKFECPICLGIIRRTKAVKDCLHRFCKECIEKSIRVCKNECPVCGTHCASRRSLRDDPNYDNLISLFYPDIYKYEEEEMTLDENEIIHNNQIHASIAQTLQSQTEARKRNVRAIVEASSKRLQSTYYRAHLRRSCRNLENAGEIHVSNDNEDMNDDDDVGRGSSSGVEKTETRAQKGGEQAHFPQESFTIDVDGTDDDNISNMNREIINSYATLALGRNYHQSNTGIDGENAQSGRLSRFIDHLRNSNVNDDKLEIHLMLVTLDEQRIPSLQEPYLCCRPTLLVKTLKKYVAFKVGLLADEVELCLVEEPQANVIRGEGVVDPNKDKFGVLRDEETLAELYARNAFSCGHLLLAYKTK